MSPLAAVLAAPLRAYQRWISPGIPPHCRFTPTCSHYAVQALRTRGAVVGLALALRRVGRCHPFHPGGHDPVPERHHRNSSTSSNRTNAPFPARPGVPS